MYSLFGPQGVCCKTHSWTVLPAEVAVASLLLFITQEDIPVPQLPLGI